MCKVYYDGDASKIIGERLILELIQEKTIIVRDNQIWVDSLKAKGTIRYKARLFHEAADREYRKLFAGAWIYRDGDFIVTDFDMAVVEKLLNVKDARDITREMFNILCPEKYF